MPTQMRTLKVYLIPTKEQETLFQKSCGVSRWAYNYALDINKDCYEQLNRYMSEQDIRKTITQLKKDPEYQWLKEVNNNVYKQSVKDQNKAFQGFFNTKKGFPKFKRKNASKDSFYIDNSSGFKFSTDGKQIQIPSIGKVQISKSFFKFNLQNLNSIKLYNTHVCKDSTNQWYITITFEATSKTQELTTEVLGIDVGIKNTAILSNGITLKNINKSKEIKRLQKKKKRMQRKISKKYEANKEGTKFIKTNNIKKLHQQLRKVEAKLKNIRANHLHQISSYVVKTKPQAIVMETLNIKGMLKNKHLAKAIQAQSLFELKRQIKYKSEFRGIQFIEAPTNYPSTKMHNTCGSIKPMSLGQRTYDCPICNTSIDRDLNAAINLANYGKKQLNIA